MIAGITMDEWLNATRAATQETVTTMLRLDMTPLAHESQKLDAESLSGAYIALTTEDDSVQIGLVTSKKGCQTLAKAMFGMDETDELSEPDVGDAVGEIVNIIAGVVKRQLNHKVHNSINLGLPKFVSGNIKPCNQKEAKEMKALIGDTASKLLIIKVL